MCYGSGHATGKNDGVEALVLNVFEQDVGGNECLARHPHLQRVGDGRYGHGDVAPTEAVDDRHALDVCITNSLSSDPGVQKLF